jgi:phosphoesterase RecJ-like protein
MSVHHHISGEKFAQNNFSIPNRQRLVRLLRIFSSKKWEITEGTATALYRGIVTDTGNFSYSSTTARTLFLAARLALQRADPNRIVVNIYQNESREKFALMQRFWASLRYYADGKICVGRVPEQDYLEMRTKANDTEGFANQPCFISGVCIAAIAYARDWITRISLRSDDPVLRLNLFAAKFSGGGHTCALAFTVNDVYEKFEKILINALQAHLESFSTDYP